MLSHAISRFIDSQRRGGPATVPAVRYDVRVVEGRVEVRRSPATLQPN